MDKLITLDEIQLDTYVNPADGNEVKFLKRGKYYSMLLVKSNTWINYLTRSHLQTFKENRSKKWKVIELKTNKGNDFYWLEGLERYAKEEEETL